MGLFGSSKKDASAPAMGFGPVTAATFSNKITPSSNTSFDGYNFPSRGSTSMHEDRSASPSIEKSTGFMKSKKKDKKAQAQAQAQTQVHTQHVHDYMLQQQLHQQQYLNSQRLELKPTTGLNVPERGSGRQDIARFSINGMLALVERRMEETENTFAPSQPVVRQAHSSNTPSFTADYNPYPIQAHREAPLPKRRPKASEEQEILSPALPSQYTSPISSIPSIHKRQQSANMVQRRAEPPTSVSSVLSEAASLRDEVSILLESARRASASSGSDVGFESSHSSSPRDTHHHNKTRAFGRLFGTKSKSDLKREQQRQREEGTESESKSEENAFGQVRRRVQSTGTARPPRPSLEQAPPMPSIGLGLPSSLQAGRQIPVNRPFISQSGPAQRQHQHQHSPRSITPQPTPNPTIFASQSVPQLDGPLTKTYGEELFSKPVTRSASPTIPKSVIADKGHGRKRSLSTPNPIPARLYLPPVPSPAPVTPAARPPVPTRLPPAPPSSSVSNSKPVRPEHGPPPTLLRQVISSKALRTTPNHPGMALQPHRAQCATANSNSTSTQLYDELEQMMTHSAPVDGTFSSREPRDRSNSDASVLDPVVAPQLAQQNRENNGLGIDQKNKNLAVKGPIGPPPRSPLPLPPPSSPPRHTTKESQARDREQESEEIIRCAHASIISAYQRHSSDLPAPPQLPNSPSSNNGHSTTSPRPSTSGSSNTTFSSFITNGTFSSSTHSSARFSDTDRSGYGSSTTSRRPSLSVDGSHCTTNSTISYEEEDEEEEDSASEYGEDQEEGSIHSSPSYLSRNESRRVFKQRSRDRFTHLDSARVQEVDEEEQEYAESRKETQGQGREEQGYALTTGSVPLPPSFNIINYNHKTKINGNNSYSNQTGAQKSLYKIPVNHVSSSSSSRYTASRPTARQDHGKERQGRLETGY